MPDTTSVPSITFHDGNEIPQLGLGVWRVADEIAADVVETAIRAGYRHIDTAAIYENERGVGDGLRASGVARDEVFVTTKLWNTDQGRDTTLQAFDESCQRLWLDHVELYLIHWPAPAQDRYVESWKALVELRHEGRARSIGVSNFGSEHIDRIVDATSVVPVLNQIELHPYFPQRTLRAAHARLGIATQAWSPLGQGGELLREPEIVRIADSHRVTSAQVVLRWHVQQDVIAIPKSQNSDRMAQNLDVFGFELTPQEMHAIDALDRGAAGRIGPDPAVATF